MIRAFLAASFAIYAIPLAGAAGSTPAFGRPEDCMRAPVFKPGTPIKKRPGQPNKVLVFDASPSEEYAATANRIFVLSACTKSSVVSELWVRLDSLFHPKSGDAKPYAADSLREFLFQNADKLAQLSSNRWISHKGDQIDVYVVHSKGVKKQIDFDEVARKSRIERDLTTLIQVAGKIGAAAEANTPKPDTSRFRVTERSFFLGKELGNLKVSVGAGPAAGKPAAGPKPAPTPQPAPPNAPKPPKPSPKPPTIASDQTSDEAENPDPAGERGPEKLETTIVTGPMEQFFLSANAGLTNATQVSYDATTRTLGPAKKPTGFYIAANYAFGDLYDEGKETNFANRFFGGMYLGVFVQASRRPFEQFGTIIGFRRHFIPWLETYLPLDTVSPYLGVVWVRNDSLSASPTGPTLSSHYGKAQFVTGLSLNLDKALGWVGSGKSEKTSD